MKIFKILSFAMLVMMMPVLTACGDDDNGKGSGASNFTQDEIIEMLTGKWGIYGHVSLSSSEGDSFENDYTGTIEFKANLKYTVSSSAIYTEEFTFNGQTQKIEVDLSDIIGGNFMSYSIMKKNGETYISFDNYAGHQMLFHIESLTKNSFRLVEDEDFENEKSNGQTVKLHYYITIISD